MSVTGQNDAAQENDRKNLLFAEYEKISCTPRLSGKGARHEV
jgi:hypothetical protein